MKYVFGSLLIGILFFTSCEDVVDVKTDQVSDVLAVDAWLTIEARAQRIRLFNANAYLDNSSPSPVSGANVSVQNLTTGTKYEFVHGGDGYYVWDPQDTQESLGDVGDEFRLSMELNGQTYTAGSYVGGVPVIDSIGQTFEDDDLREDGIYLTLFARDLPGLDDAYWIKTYKNDTFLNAANRLNIAYDGSTTPAARADSVIFIPPIQSLLNDSDKDGMDIPWRVGEEARIEILSITVDAFEFLRIARDQILNGDNGIFSSPLASARSNILNEQSGQRIQGFFNVSAVSSAEKTIE